uniref:Putative secreted protein n=1 Tax=Anopheles triannulatus TaxID=58253 RepID=A0A2M4B2R6_9DIPT
MPRSWSSCVLTICFRGTISGHNLSPICTRGRLSSTVYATRTRSRYRSAIRRRSMRFSTKLATTREQA